MVYGPDVLADIARRCEASPEREACGFVVRRGEALAVIEVENAADRLHASDPVSYPRSGRHRYVMDPDALLGTFEAVARDGGEVVAVWHSHIDAPAILSGQDRADAVLDGEPTLPGAEYLVVSVRAGRAVEARRFVLQGVTFAEAPLS